MTQKTQQVNSDRNLNSSQAEACKQSLSCDNANKESRKTKNTSLSIRHTTEKRQRKSRKALKLATVSNDDLLRGSTTFAAVALHLLHDVQALDDGSEDDVFAIQP